MRWDLIMALTEIDFTIQSNSPKNPAINQLSDVICHSPRTQAVCWFFDFYCKARKPISFGREQSGPFCGI